VTTTRNNTRVVTYNVSLHSKTQIVD